MTDHPELSARAKGLITNSAHEVLFSAASGWEIAINTQLGRLTLPEPPHQFVPRQIALNGFQHMPILLSHALHVATLPMLHRDPFDRLLVAQAQAERVPIVTADADIARYGVKTIW